MYSYQLPSSTNEHVVLHRRRTWVYRALFISLAVVPLLAALCFAALQLEGLPQQLLPMGAALMTLGVSVIVMHDSRPKVIVFHNDHQRIYFLNRKGQNLAISPSLPYSEFDEFALGMQADLTEVDLHPRHFFQPAPRYQLDWALLLKKCDGSLLSLGIYPDEDSALLAYTELERAVVKSIETSATESSYTPPIFHVDASAKQTDITWSVKRLLTRSVGLWLIALASPLIVLGAIALGGAWVRLALATLAIATLVAWVFYRAPTHMRIRITEHELQVFSAWRLFGEATPKVIALQDIYALNFELHSSYANGSQRGWSPLGPGGLQMTVIPKTVHEAVTQPGDGGLQNPIIALLSQLGNLVQIDCIGLDFEKALALEQLIQREIHRLSGRQIV